MKKLFVVVLLPLILTFIIFSSSEIAEGYETAPATLYVYEDGTVLIQQIIHTNNPPENISIFLLGDPFLIEVKSDSALIHVNIADHTASFIAPSEQVELSYMTSSLTNKTGDEWTLSYSSPYKTLVILPENSMPYNVSPSDFDVNIVNNSVALVMSPGEVMIKYVLTPQPTEKGKTTTPSPYTINLRYLLIIFSILAIAVIIYLFYQKRRKSNEPIYKNLDERDNKILTILSKYGELTAREIMEKTSIPKTPLYRRLRKLMDLGLIETKSTGGVPRYRIKSKI